MGGSNFYLLASLPSLGEPGSVPPLGPGEFLARVRDADGPTALIELLYLGSDLLLRDAFLAGELSEPAPLVLSAAQVRDEAPLPSFLAAADANVLARRIAGDDVWEAYYARAARAPSAFVRALTAYDVGLRNALAAARARTLGLEAADYLVAPALQDPTADYGAVLAEWSQAPTPLAGLRVLDAARWAWVAAHDGWFSYADDEVAAYGVKLLVLDRWQRLARAEHAQAEAAIADGR